MDEEACPTGCDPKMYEAVLELREKRLDMEEALAEIQKAVEDLKRNHTKYLSDEKKLEKEQLQSDEKIQQFQSEKQGMLNKVEIPATLRLSQIQCLERDPAAEDSSFTNSNESQVIGLSEDMAVDNEFNLAGAGHQNSSSQQLSRHGGACGGVSVGVMHNGTLGHKMPAELQSGYLLFPRKRLDVLMRRITELHKEKFDKKAEFRELRRDLIVRSKAKAGLSSTIESLQEKYEEIQQFKFGKKIDLELLEECQGKSHLVELQARIASLEQEADTTLKNWAKKLEKAKKMLGKETEQNSSLLTGIVEAGKKKLELDEVLNMRLKNVTIKDDVSAGLKSREEETLKNQIMAQANEIGALQQEIQLFRRKGGHIYTTVTSNRGTGGSN